MILFVLSIALMNFGLGYALAVVCSAAPLDLPMLIRRMWRKLRSPSATVVDDPLVIEDAGTTLATLADLPPAWLDQLTAASLKPASFVEGLLLKLWIEMTPYREQLLTAEVRGRLALSRLDQPSEAQLLGDVRVLQSMWVEYLQSINQCLQSKLEHLGDDAAVGGQLDLLLSQQLTALNRIATEQDQIAVDKEPEQATRKLLALLASSIDLLHRQRDRVQILLAQQLRGRSELYQSGQPLYLDPLTGQISRLGIENLFERWWHDDPQRLRLVSCALVDVDRFSRLNDRLGHRAGDRLLHAISALVGDGIRTDRGFDRLARFSGQQFLLFFGDTGPRNAVSAVERIRQSLEAVTLDYEGNELDVAISAGVTLVLREDTIETFFARLQLALLDAKKQGRNRTAIDDSEGPETIFKPQRYSARAKRVRIEAA